MQQPPCVEATNSKKQQLQNEISHEAQMNRAERDQSPNRSNCVCVCVFADGSDVISGKNCAPQPEFRA
jgi:hypothetical protein